MWEIYCSYTNHWKSTGLFKFYLLPSIEFRRDNINDDIGDYSFDIDISWLLWQITISKYWGKKYSKNK